MHCKTCRMCLDDTLKVANSNNTALVQQLVFIAPEIEWSEPLLICSLCQASLQSAYNFKKLCLDNHKQLQTSINPNSVDKSEHNSILDSDTVDIESENSCTESRPEIFTCYHCEQAYNTKSQLERHLKQSHKTFQCRQCETTFNTKTELKLHSKTEHKLIKFQCQECNEPFSLLKEIVHHCANKHSLSQKDIKPYHCSQCQKRFASCSLLIQHKKYHTGIRSFVCTICGKSFVTKRDLSGHEKLHSNQRSYSCTTCDKTFNTSQNLKTHNYVVHTDSSQWKYSCPICSKRFAMKANWNEHIKRHKGNKEYECYVCKKMFVSNHEMKKHIKLHSNITTLKCSECDKLYRDKRCLDQHLFKVHGLGEYKQVLRVKKYVCHICPSQFYDNSKLQRHIRTHTGKKPFCCSHCDKRFIDKSYLSQHLKTVHKTFEIFSTKDFIKYL